MLTIAEIALPCAVLDTKMRVFSQRGMFSALGGGRRDRGDELPGFLGSKSISPWISEELTVALRTPVVYRPRHGGRTALGYEATMLAAVCDAVLEARKNKSLQPNQIHLAAQAEALVRAFAKVGIVALIDEATGYQVVLVPTTAVDVHLGPLDGRHGCSLLARRRIANFS